MKYFGLGYYEQKISFIIDSDYYVTSIKNGVNDLDLRRNFSNFQ